MKKLIASLLAASLILFSVTPAFSGSVIAGVSSWPVGGAVTTPRTWQFTPSAVGTFRLLWLSINFDLSGTTETFALEINNAQGTKYDTVVKAVTMVSQSDYFWIPDQEFIIGMQSGVSISCTSAGATNNINVTIQYESGVR